MIKKYALLCAVLLTTTSAIAGQCAPKQSCTKPQKTVCCGAMGGVSYCDSSAGRLVCKNGEYSSCYCDRHAIMDMQLLQGCCLWHGGVLSVDINGMVLCNDGSISEACTEGNQAYNLE